MSARCCFGRTTCGPQGRFEYLQRWTEFNRYQWVQRPTRIFKVQCWQGPNWYGPICTGTNRYTINRCKDNCRFGIRDNSDNL